MTIKKAEVRCAYCLAINSVPPGNARCCCETCGRFFELTKATSGFESPAIHSKQWMIEPPIVVPPMRGIYRETTAPKIAAWPRPALAVRSEEGRHKFFSLAFINLALIAAPLFAVMLAVAIGNEVGTLGLIAIIPFAIASALAMGLGVTWLHDNARREREGSGKSLRTPFFLHFYVLTRWAICWRPMVLITLGGAFYTSLILFLMRDHLAPMLASNRNQAVPNQTALNQSSSPFESVEGR